MTLTRRRFVTLAAAFAATPVNAATESWQGRAFGADVDITIKGPQGAARAALNDAREIILRVEQLFSLYDRTSTLSLLNHTGQLVDPPPLFATLMQSADLLHRATNGLFDPTVQPLWRALAEGRDPAQALPLIDWSLVSHSADRISLGPGQTLTFNGIAQGFATDLVSERLTSHGLTNTLVNIGEYRGAGGPWRLGLSDPEHGLMGTRTLTSGAIATSSPHAMSLAGSGHILHRKALPKWSTVSVQAESATIADAASTALVLAEPALIARLAGQHGIRQITVIDFGGNLTTHT